jgi:D-alanyl-D-alanine dipeptidase
MPLLWLYFCLILLMSAPARCQAPGDTLRLLMEKRPLPPPYHLRGIIGDYEGEKEIFSIREEGGSLQILARAAIYPLPELSYGLFRLPEEAGLGSSELIFLRQANEFSLLCSAGNTVFSRKSYAVAIAPQRSIRELREEALRATPPVEKGAMMKTDLVEVPSIIPDIKLDIRYATSRNFMSVPLYDEPRAFLQRPAAEALARVQKRLAGYGFGLVIFDAYRPWYVTKMFWDGTPPEKRDFVADPEKGSFHNRGMAVDVTLCERESGRSLDMGGEYDEFGIRSYPDYQGGASLERWRRKVLRIAMEAEGFVVYPCEWWHFTFRPEQKYALMNVTFQQLHR